MAASSTHTLLGSEAQEALYRATLAYELGKNNIAVTKERISLPGKHKITRIIKINMIVEELIIVLPQTRTEPADIKRARSYLNLAGKEMALLINFSVNSLSLENGIVIVYPHKQGCKK